MSGRSGRRLSGTRLSGASGSSASRLSFALLALASACGKSSGSSDQGGVAGVSGTAGASLAGAGGASGNSAHGGSSGGAGRAGTTGEAGEGEPGGAFGSGDAGDGGSAGASNLSFDCDAAAAQRSSVGCEFWPTVSYNPVYSVFDFGVALANDAGQDALIAVTRGGAAVATQIVPAHSIATIKLPWVPALKGADFGATGMGGRPTESVRVDGGAYRLTSTVPVSVYQFSPLDTQKEAAVCPYPPSIANGDGVHCEALLSDAALLLPSSALTGNYVFLGQSTTPIASPEMSDTPGVYTVTATADATHVVIGATAAIAAGTGVLAVKAGGVTSFDMNAGDVIELLGAPALYAGTPHADLAGSLLNANHPVQLLSSVPFASPGGVACCADRLEETVPPVETLGTDYVVVPPSSAKGSNVGHTVRLVGLKPTTLIYDHALTGGPSKLAAGQVVQFDSQEAFTVHGTAAFGVVSISPGGTVQNGCSEGTGCYIGDSSMTQLETPQQFQARYAFPSSGAFSVTYADVVAPKAATVTLDGSPLAKSTELVADTWAVYRLDIGGAAALHVLESEQAFGVQLIGSTYTTSYYVPAGQGGKLLTQPPVVVQ